MSSRVQNINVFQRTHSGRLVRSTGNLKFSHQSRYSKARSSHHGFSKKARTQHIKDLTWFKVKKSPKKTTRNSYENDTALSKLSYRRDMAYQRIQEASKKLKYWRLTNKRLTEMELNTEIDLLYEGEVLSVIANYMDQIISIPPSMPNNVIYLKDITFGISKYAQWNYEFYEHFLCVVTCKTDVEVTRLVTLNKDYVTFTESFRYEVNEDNFAVEVKLYSIKDKHRSTFNKTKQFLKKVFSSCDKVSSRFVCHGRMMITNKHIGDCQRVLFEHHSPASRVGKTSVKLYLTNRYKVDDHIYSSIKNCHVV